MKALIVALRARLATARQGQAFAPRGFCWRCWTSSDGFIWICHLPAHAGDLHQDRVYGQFSAPSSPPAAQPGGRHKSGR